MRIWNILPMRDTVLVRGSGCNVYDADGKTYLDLQSGYWCNVLGYGDPALIEPVREQVGRLTNVMSSFMTREIGEAMAELEKVLPPELCRAAFLNSGSEAVDLALKMSRAATGRTGVAVNEKGYYGATSYTLALSGAGAGASYLPDPGEVHRVPPPLCHMCEHGTREMCRDFRCLEKLERLAEEGNSNTAAVMYEPVLGAGILVPPIGYGAKLREIADALGTLLISEEVTTAPCKTGRWWAYQHDGIVPDILVLGKAVGAGFPVSVVVTTGRVEEMCRGVLRHVQSHQNDALSGRVVATVIDVMRREGMAAVAAEKGEYFLGALRDVCDGSLLVADVRGRGLMLGVELSKEYAGLGEGIQWELIGKGYLMDFHQSSCTFRFFPPYVITTAEIDSFAAAFGETLSSARRQEAKKPSR